MSLIPPSANASRGLSTEDLILIRARKRLMQMGPPWQETRRFEQIPPLGDWLIWYVQAGRGWGKTRTGAEWVYDISEHARRIAIVAPTFGDGRDICIEGESGLKTLYPKLSYNRSLGQITFPSGSIGKIYSSMEPDRLRGPNNYAAVAMRVRVAATRVTR